MRQDGKRRAWGERFVRPALGLASAIVCIGAAEARAGSPSHGPAPRTHVAAAPVRGHFHWLGHGHGADPDDCAPGTRHAKGEWGPALAQSRHLSELDCRGLAGYAEHLRNGYNHQALVQYNRFWGGPAPEPVNSGSSTPRLDMSPLGNFGDPDKPAASAAEEKAAKPETKPEAKPAAAPEAKPEATPAPKPATPAPPAPSTSPAPAPAAGSR